MATKVASTAAKSPTGGGCRKFFTTTHRSPGPTYSTTRPSALEFRQAARVAIRALQAGLKRPDRIRLVALTESILLQVQELRVGGRAGVPAGDKRMVEVAKANPVDGTHMVAALAAGVR